MPGWPDLSTYPGWVNVLAGALFAFGIAAVALASFFGQLRGKQAPIEDRHDNAQLTLATLDSTAIREHAAAVRDVGTQLDRLNGIGEKWLTVIVQRQEEDDLRAARDAGFEEGQRAARARARPPKKPPGMNLRSTAP